MIPTDIIQKIKKPGFFVEECKSIEYISWKLTNNWDKHKDMYKPVSVNIFTNFNLN